MPVISGYPKAVSCMSWIRALSAAVNESMTVHYIGHYQGLNIGG